MNPIFIVRIVPSRGDDQLHQHFYLTREDAANAIHAIHDTYQQELDQEDREELEWHAFDDEPDALGECIVGRFDTGDCEYFIYKLTPAPVRA